MACALSGTPSETYNLASGKETTISELANLINQATGNPTAPDLKPARDWDRSGKRFGSTEKAKVKLGFESSVEITDGISRLVDWTKENYSIIDGRPPEVNLVNEKNNGETVLKLIKQGLVLSAHDVSSGGLIVALSEMTFGSNFGIKIEQPKKLRNVNEYFFGEDQSRYILEINHNGLNNVEKILKNNNVYFEKIGVTQEKFFEINGDFKIDINVLYKINNEWYNKY